MNIAQLLTATARTFPDRPAVSKGATTLHRYGELSGRVGRLATALLQTPGVSIGRCVVVYMGNGPQYIEVLFAIWHAGLCAVPINAKLHPREAAFILDNCNAALCLANEETAVAAQTAVEACSADIHMLNIDTPAYANLFRTEEAARQHRAHRDDLAWIFYTSGTTGRPKGAMLSHGNLHAVAQAYLCDIDQLDESDCLLHLGPQSHAAGLFCLAHIAKGSNQVVPISRSFDAAETVDLVNHYSTVSLFLAPTMLRRLLASADMKRLNVAHVRTVLCGAAPIYADDVRAAIDAFGLRFWNGYGQGESPCTITAMPKHLYRDDGSDEFAERLVSVGIARTGVEIRIADDAGLDLPAGEIGEILVRGSVVMSGYLNDVAASDAALRDGWLHTGDLGAMDTRGFLFLKDRLKDLIISGGSNVYPREVEEVLLGAAAVDEVAVIGVPDAEWGEAVIAFVVTKQGLLVDPEGLDAHCLTHMARYKRPKRYHFIEALPKNNYGKVLKTELRARLVRKG